MRVAVTTALVTIALTTLWVAVSLARISYSLEHIR